MLALLLLVVVTGKGAQQSSPEESGSMAPALQMSYDVVKGAIPAQLTNCPGDPERGRQIVLDRERGDCVVCHAMPLPDRQFHGAIGPPLDGVGNRYSAGELRLRLVDPKALNPQTVMPAYYKIEGLYQVAEDYRGKPILTAQEIEDVVAYLLTLK